MCGSTILEDKGAHTFQNHPVAKLDTECMFQIRGQGDNAPADTATRGSYMPMLGVGRDFDWQTGDLRPVRLCGDCEVWCEWPCLGTLSLCDGVTHEAKDDA